MIQKQILVMNDIVQVLYQMNPEMIVVTNMQPFQQRVFAGYDGLKDQHDTFSDSFSESTDFNTAIDFFKPNIKTTHF